ncbi:NADP-binding protein [Gigaspora margarita]|uniref:NADP-binding protein n=1 Tax=Gigaspora margarita TaxID=4874 RepID=A0A8H4ABS5_GIGMA|nr:NADP-binding protein [Gigaspora margarita]
MSDTSFKVVTIAGGTGLLGFNITYACLNDGSYKVKILRKKPESENNNANLLASKGAEVIYVDYNDKNDLVKALEGTDVIISAIGRTKELLACQRALLNAAKVVGVKRFIPSEFGAELKETTDEMHPFLKPKDEFFQELKNSGIEYTMIITGIFYEYLGAIGFDYKNKKATFSVDGNTKVAGTSCADIGKYTVESLKLPEVRNGTIRVAGFVLTLNELLKKFEQITDAKWEVSNDFTLRQRYKNNTAPVPTIWDDFYAYVIANLDIKKLHNDKFSFTPQPVTEGISALVKN